MASRTELCNRYLRNYKKTAFNWDAYTNRCCSLRLLREEKILVDTLIETRDGFSDAVHWQVLIALCPKLIAASHIKQIKEGYFLGTENTDIKQRLIFPDRVNGLIARKLVDCAYGKEVLFTKSTLCDFYNISNRYDIEYALKLCLNYARNLLDCQNCIRLLLLSLKHKHRKLQKAAYSILVLDFKYAIQYNRDFHLLPCDLLKKLLLDDFLGLNEDEEFAWLAIVRWLSLKPIHSKDLKETYNQMVTIGPTIGLLKSSRQQGQYQCPIVQQQIIAGEIQSTLNTYNTSSYYAIASETQDLNSIEKKSLLADPLNGILMKKDLPRFHRTEEEVSSLIKCLRFLRFRSLSSFNVILSHKFVKSSEKISNLVEYMRLRYIIKKNLPLDKEYAKQILPKGKLKSIRRSETTKSQRVVETLVKLIGHRSVPVTQVGLKQLTLGGGNCKNQKATLTPETSKRIGNIPNKIDEAIIEELSKDHLHQAQEPRIPNSVALLIGGWSDGAVSKSMLAYDYICDKWFKLNIHLPEPRSFHASCSLPGSGEIFILGGTDGDQILSSVLKFQPTTDIRLNSRCRGSGRRNCKLCLSKQYHGLSYRFHSLSSMIERRCHLSSVFHSDGRVYALGGHNGQQRLRSGEWYNPETDEWIRIADMTIARSDASACSHENKIFIAGGQIGDQYIQASVEFYKSSDNTWTFAAPMIVPRMSFKLVSFKGHLLAIGGTNGLMGGDEIGSMTRSVERYEPSQSSWSLCAPMIQKRSSFDTISIGNKLMVVGGHGGRHKLKSCESLMIGKFRSASELRSVQSPVAPVQAQSTLFNSPILTAQKSFLAGQRVIFGDVHNLNQRNSDRSYFANPSISPLRTAMRWIEKAKLPSKRSGFSIAVVECPISIAREFTYHGAKRSACHKASGSIVKRKSRWHRFKFIKRRKLIKHLKIALVITVVILIM